MMDKLNHYEGLPLYKQIEKYVRNRIDNNEWPVGYQIPTENEFSKTFEVSRITVIKALERLVEEGMLVRMQGKGTFVSRVNLSYEQKKLMSFTEETKQKGKVPTSIILSKSRENPSLNTRKRLNLNELEPVWSIQRLMIENNTPISIQTSYLPVKYFPELIRNINDNQSLYELLQDKYSTVIDYAYEMYKAVQLNEEEKGLLEVDLSETGFCVDRLSYANDEPIEFVRSIIRSDKASYTVKLTRNNNA